MYMLENNERRMKYNNELFKSAPAMGYNAEEQYNLLDEDLMLPSAVVKERELRSNSNWMQEFSNLTGVSLCPHGKTTMCPQLFKIQMEQGAWGLTLANSFQVKVARQYGIQRIFLANQLVGKQNIAIILEELDKDSEFDFYCLVDDISNIDELSKCLEDYPSITLQVMIEISPVGGRAGVRELASAVELAEHIKSIDNVQLAGIECYEGVIHGDDAPALVEEFLEKVVSIAQSIDKKNLFEGDEIILTGGGTAFYDLVAKVFAPIQLSKPTRTVIRPGCYLSHDAGIYKVLQNDIKSRDIVADKIPGNLESAIEVLAYVQSIPEKNLAIINMGKRDVAFDAGLPGARAVYSRKLKELIRLNSSKLTNINDQHAFMEYNDDYDLQVGDIVIFDVSHPCLTFDKWKHIPLVDDSYNVLDILNTYF